MNLAESNFGKWGGNLFYLLTGETSQDAAVEAVRAYNGLVMHLYGLVEVTSKLAILARQLDPRKLTGMFRGGGFA